VANETNSDQHRDTTRSRAHLGMLLRALILGLSFTVVGLTGAGLPPLLLTALRFAVAAIALLPQVWHAHERWPGPRAFVIYSVLGLCQAAFFGAMFWAAHRISALSMALLYGSVPFLAYCLGLGFRVERPSAPLLGILVTGAAGSLSFAWAEKGSALGGLRLGLAEVVYFAGCLGLALYSVLSRWSLSQRWISGSAAVRAFWSVAVGAILVGTLGLIEEKPQELARMKLPDVLLLAYLGILSTAGTFWLMQRAAAVLSPAATTAYAYAVPFVSMLLLFIMEPQRITWRWLPGAVLVFLAMTLLFRRDAPESSSRAGDIHPTGGR
jgi:drug/metabolite transporter (DMT)-like permease